MKALFNQSTMSMLLDGQAVVPNLARLVSSALVRQELGAPAVAEVDFAAPNAAEIDQFKIGKPFCLRMAGAQQPLFDGEITGISHHYGAGHVTFVRVHACDVLQRLRKRFRPRVLGSISAANLANTLAGELGLTSVCYGNANVREAVIQHEQSDFDLLADLAAEAGFYPILDGAVLVLTGLDGFGEEIELRFGAECSEVDVSLSNDRNTRGTTVAGWNTASATVFSVTSTVSRQDAFEMRDVSPNEGAEGYRTLLNRIFDSAGEAGALAQADFDRAVTRSVQARGVALGDVRLSPGRPIRLLGVAEAVAGRYVITSAVHQISAVNGYSTTFSTEPPARLARPRTPLVMLGIVADTQDAERLGRCRVQLVVLGETITPWLQVMIAGAGEGKGIAVFPETGDKVLVLCPDGDPARGIVLGSLYGENALPRGLSENRPRPFILRTANGQRLELSSTNATARLATASGSVLELMPGRARLAAASDLVIEAPGKTITFRADSINFERG